jgi:hypothetical protein
MAEAKIAKPECSKQVIDKIMLITAKTNGWINPIWYRNKFYALYNGEPSYISGGKWHKSNELRYLNAKWQRGRTSGGVWQPFGQQPDFYYIAGEWMNKKQMASSGLKSRTPHEVEFVHGEWTKGDSLKFKQAFIINGVTLREL